MSKHRFVDRFPLWLRKPFRRKSPPALPAEVVLQINALPTVDEILDRSAELPKNCRESFVPAPLHEEGMLIGRDKELEALEKVFKNWQEGHPASVALVGPQGCGKTSLINCFLQRQPRNLETLRVDMQKRLSSEQGVLEFFSGLFHIHPPQASIEELISRVLETEPSLVVLEGAHHLLFRIIGGRMAAEMFLYILLCTRKRHFWLVACRRFPWNALDRHVGISRYFSSLVNMDELAEDNLREALRLRLKKCGLQAVFCTSREEYNQGRQFETEEQEKLEDVFYRAVLANSGRNFQAALYFLLLCCRYDAGTQSLWFYPPDRLVVPAIKEMDHVHLLTLAELAGHGVLSTREHGQIFRMADVQSASVLEYLEQLKLVVPLAGQHADGHRVYDASPMVHHSFTRVLEQMNLLY